MYITPDTNIWLLHGCPLDADYENTIIFQTKEKQRAWFAEFEKISLSGYSYQRVGRNILRAGVPAAQLYDINYMIFQNSAYSDKYFYAFVERADYINDNVTEIQYKIDVMQTWLFDYRLGQCFIERAHAATDEIGENTIPENLEIGEYQCEQLETTSDAPALALAWGCLPVFVSSIDLTKVIGSDTKPDQVYGRYIDGLYTGAGLYYYSGYQLDAPPPRMLSAFEKLDEWGVGSAILGAFMVPAEFLPNVTTIESNFVEITSFNTVNTSLPDVYNGFVNQNPGAETVGAYIPKNNKCYTYPFYKLVLSNNSGKSQDFAFELLNDRSFISAMAASPATPYLCYPRNYAGKSIECALAMDTAAQCTYNTDTYKNWLAQNQKTLTANIIGTTISGVAGVIGQAITHPKGVASTALSFGLSVYNTMAQFKDRQAVPMATNGTVAGATFLVSQGLYQPTFLLATMRPEYARIVDGYFSRFGYAQHKVDIPILQAREHYTYVKTQGCIIHGVFESGDIQNSVPAEVETQLANIYNKGVTIWRDVTGEEFGDFAISNLPRGAAATTEAIKDGES